MLYTDVNEFNWVVDNYSGSIDAAVAGVNTTAHATAHTKGSVVEILSAASMTEDAYAIALNFILGYTSGGSYRTFLHDIMVDPAGGTAWTVLIPNLMTQGTEGPLGAPNCAYYFPIFIKAGSSIGVQTQCSTGGIVQRVCARVFGKPTRPDLVKVGYTVEAIGVNTAATKGVAVTPSITNYGTFTSIGATTQDNWWWQHGISIQDTTIAGNQGLVALNISDGTNIRPIMYGMQFTTSVWEYCTKDAFGQSPPIRKSVSGESVYGAIYQYSAADSNFSLTAYGLR